MNDYYGENPVDLGALELPDWTEFMHYLYLPVRIPLTDPAVQSHSGQRAGVTSTSPGGVFGLPERLSFLGPAIHLALEDAQQHTPHLNNPYVYVTARRGYASPGNPLNRPGWHCDDWGGTDLNYIWTDAFPTRFLLSDEPLRMPEDDTLSMQAMSRYADRVGRNGGFYLDGTEVEQHLGLRLIDGPINRLLRLNPFVVHDTPVVPEPGGMRSFFKISVSSHRYDLVGNSHNYLLGYDWPMFDRQALRNQPNGFQNKDYSGRVEFP